MVSRLNSYQILKESSLYTVYRELYKTDVISQIFTQHHVEYDSDGRQGQFRWPIIVRGCIIMETLASKHLSDYTLYGIEQLFAAIVNHKYTH